MIAKVKKIFSKLFFMNEEKYQEAISHYTEKFQLKQKWNFSVVNKLPDVKSNYPDKAKVLAFTNWTGLNVVFKDSIMSMPAFIARAYIRHEMRHCQQMEKIHDLMLKKEGGLLANIYTCMIISNDNKNGYDKSIMEADAWAAFFGVNLNIKKVVKKIISNCMPFIME